MSLEKLTARILLDIIQSLPVLSWYTQEFLLKCVNIHRAIEGADTIVDFNGV